ncbi:MAG: hypothetical protein H6Q36_1022 [Chloroflexi bacterium]|nr:hypothetical protein [Chloroflexota bacterium]
MKPDRREYGPQIGARMRMGRQDAIERRRTTIELRLHGDLDDFLPVALRGTSLRRPIAGHPAVKDVIEAAGVPHPEVAMVEVNEVAVGLDRQLDPGDRVDAYPAGWRGPGLADETTTPAGPVDPPRFVLDGHLGRLAAYLRMCGFDTLYRHDAPDDELARVAAFDERVLLTRDVGLLKRSIVRRGAFVRAERPADQLAEVIRRFDLAAAVRPFERCLRCNGILVAVSRESVEAAVPPRVFREQVAFSRCPDCGGIYWRGSHHARMSRLLARTLHEAGIAGAGPQGDERTGRPGSVPTSTSP